MLWAVQENLMCFLRIGAIWVTLSSVEHDAGSEVRRLDLDENLHFFSFINVPRTC